MISESLHAGVPLAEAEVWGEPAEADLVGVTDGVGAGDDFEADGEGDGTGVGDPEGVAVGVPPPPRPPTSHTAPRTTSSTTITTRARRTQYTLGGCGPTGWITWLTWPTLRGAGPPRAYPRRARAAQWPTMTRGRHGDPPPGAGEPVTGLVLRWYDEHHRDLPWRTADRTPWGVLVSEVMLAQTPVDRVLPYWRDWLARWPTPRDLAAATPADAVRAWGRLGYPRRALRLQESAIDCVEQYAGRVPSSYDELRTLPGVGDYTAAAVLVFGFGGGPVPVLDTNVRRVLARAFAGRAVPGRSVTVAERELAIALLPTAPATAAAWSVALMELGALVCTARSPGCSSCPLSSRCRWLAAGQPASPDPPRPGQRFTGTDRQVRGLLLAVLRDDPGPLPAVRLDAVWPDPVQRARALDSLVADGLVEPMAGRRFRLPQRGSRHMVSTVGPSESRTSPGRVNRSSRRKPTDS